MIYRFCSRSHEPIIPPIPRSILVSSNGLSKFANTRRRTFTARQGREPFSITSIAIKCYKCKVSRCQGLPARVFRILRKFGCILDVPHRSHRPQERPEPGTGPLLVILFLQSYGRISRNRN
jgi:hypothetical protein